MMKSAGEQLSASVASHTASLGHIPPVYFSDQRNNKKYPSGHANLHQFLNCQSAFNIVVEKSKLWVFLSSIKFSTTGVVRVFLPKEADLLFKKLY